MAYRYAILGSGRQGTAAAYDLARFGDAAQVLLADVDHAQAERAAAKVNDLCGEAKAQSVALDVADPAAVVRLLRDNEIDVFISGVPYFYNQGLTECALEAGASMVDFGGNTDIVRKQIGRDADARAAGITLIPDCGQVPGLGTSLCAYTVDLFDIPRDIVMYDGGIPQDPQPPWNYILTFNIEGLTNEYFGTTLFIREGQRVEVPCFQEYEMVDFPEPIGRLEAFTTAGGTSNMPWTYEGRLRTLLNKTIRWPGHYAQWKAFSDAGLLALEPVDVDGQRVVPRQLLHTVLEPKIRARPGERDIVIVRVVGRGEKDGREAEAVVELFDTYDEATGFTAMERTTGWHAAIMAGFIARGVTSRGALPVEAAVPSARFVGELEKRGLNVTVRWR